MVGVHNLPVAYHGETLVRDGDDNHDGVGLDTAAAWKHGMSLHEACAVYGRKGV